MLRYALVFLVIALIAGWLGFGVAVGTAAAVAQVCFIVFIVMFLAMLFGGRNPSVRAGRAKK